MASTDLIAIKIDTEPQDAEVYINGYPRRSYCCLIGDNVEWAVLKTGYVPQSGTLDMEKDTNLNIELESGGEHCVSINVSSES